jgi:hypothetical protein
MERYSEGGRPPYKRSWKKPHPTSPEGKYFRGGVKIAVSLIPIEWVCGNE